MKTDNRYFINNLPGQVSAELVRGLESYAETQKRDVYCLSAPLKDEKYNYRFEKGWSLLIPGFPLMFINDGGDEEEFKDYVDDYIDDISHISDQAGFTEKLGRKRTWDKYIKRFDKTPDIEDILGIEEFDSTRDKRMIDLFIALILGSYNDAAKIEIEGGESVLDLIKNKILLFDCNQIRFLYKEPPAEEKIIYIQGLAGTGKTELLLHKLKNLYVKYPDAMFGFTCFNKVLASVLLERIPKFFNQMGANKQIDWKGNMLCASAWGSHDDARSGILRFIIDFYHLPWYSLRDVGTFERACNMTLENFQRARTEMTDFEYCFTYLFIDESQDFPDSFFQLAKEVTEKRVYAAGDIFQNIFKIHKLDLSENAARILLNQCYRTDPRTFMFAHAMGLGLLENKKINWLSDEDWEKCGYQVEKLDGGSAYKFRRLPIRRFEDLGADYPPMRIYRTNNYLLGIVREIEEWKKDFPNLSPDDIGIIFLDNKSDIYLEMEKVGEALQRKYGWNYSIAHMQKSRVKGSLFISNRNNVKGLEFPFVFCLTSGIKNDMPYRHTLYTMLSRSHLRSVLVFNDPRVALKESVEKGVNEIMKDGSMTVKVPTKEEMEEIQLAINTKGGEQSLEQRIQGIMITENIPYSNWEAVTNILNASLKGVLENMTDSQLRAKICQAWGLMQV